MKRLIAVFTCHAYTYEKQDEGAAHHSGVQKNRSQAIRNTWYRTWEENYKDQIDLKFFFGRWPQEATRCPLPNEVFLDVPDDYNNVSYKVQGMCKWALANNYDQILKIDDDVYLYIDRLLDNLDNSDYRGYEIELSNCQAATGAAYWLTNKAMQIVADAEVDPKERREEIFIGRALSRNGISLIHEPRFQPCLCDVCLEKYPESVRITSHTAKPERMYELHTQV